MRSLLRGDVWSADGGSVTAEFALVLPAVAVMLAIGLGVVHLGALQVGLTDAAADAARLIGRGDSEGAALARIVAAAPGAGMTVTGEGLLVCVTASASVSVGALGSLFELSGQGCALDDRAGGSE